MDLLNVKVKHITWGIGLIIETGTTYVTVAFETKTSKFIYPDVFTNYIKAVDSATQDVILQEIENRKAAEEASRAQIATVIPVKNSDNLVRSATAKRKARNDASPAVKVERPDGKRMTFFVFQGSTFEKEYRGGYIWAPTANRAGNTFHHWDRLRDVRAGDVLFHGCDGDILAISVAMANCYECLQPAELTTEELWDDEGRRVDCAYMYMDRPVKTSTFSNDILRLCGSKYSPFNKCGNGNMGYLFELNHELAQIFLSALARQNAYINSLDYVQALLA